MERPEKNDMNPRHPELWDEPDHIRKEMARTMNHIYSHGMTTTSGGNMSVIDSLGNIWITPSGTDKGALQPGELVCVASDGSFEGSLKPSMEYPLHRAVYKARPDIRALIHAHPPMLTSFSIVHRITDTSVIREWRETCGTTGYAGYATPGSDLMAENVASEFTKGHSAVMMENHAVVTGGRNLSEALARLETLENCARTIHSAGFIGEIIIPGSVQDALSEPLAGHQSGNSGPEPEVREGDSFLSPEEELLAEEICRITVRACDRGLVYGFSGELSARSTGNNFLMTQEGILRYEIKKTGITRCNTEMDSIDHTRSPGFSSGGTGMDDMAHAGSHNTGKDSIDRTSCGGTGSASWMHAEIYRRLPSVNAVIKARPPYLMAFAVTGKEIDVRTIPESWLLLQEMPSLPPDVMQPGRTEIFDRLAGGAPVLLINNDSVIVTGDSLLQAFDRLEVAEMTAMSLILAKPLGKVLPISEEQVEALRRTFRKQ